MAGPTVGGRRPPRTSPCDRRTADPEGRRGRPRAAELLLLGAANFLAVVALGVLGANLQPLPPLNTLAASSRLRCRAILSELHGGACHGRLLHPARPAWISAQTWPDNDGLACEPYF